MTVMGCRFPEHHGSSGTTVTGGGVLAVVAVVAVSGHLEQIRAAASAAVTVAAWVTGLAVAGVGVAALAVTASRVVAARRRRAARPARIAAASWVWQDEVRRAGRPLPLPPPELAPPPAAWPGQIPARRDGGA